MSIFWHRRPGIVNVRMVITEEKILSNIDKVQKLKGKYRTILDIFYEMLEKLYKNVTVNEAINVNLKKKSKLNKITDIVKQSI